MNKIVFDLDRHFAEELWTIIQIFDNRRKTGDPLTASEYLIQVPRDKYERLCRLSLEALQHPNKHTDDPQHSLDEAWDKFDKQNQARLDAISIQNSLPHPSGPIACWGCEIGGLHEHTCT